MLEVCRSSATRQGAYDFLSNDRVSPDAIQDAVTQSVGLGCSGTEFCFVVVDGTALTLTDWRRKKDFGAIGATNLGARGLKVINAYAIAMDGTPIGLLAQRWWKREAHLKRKDCQFRTVDQKETRHWLDAIRRTTLSMAENDSRAWFQLDREGDRYATLKTLHESGQWFTVRSTYGHRFLVGCRRTTRLRHAVAKSRVRGSFQLKVPAKFNRLGRKATMLVRTTSVVLDMKEPSTGDQLHLSVNVVDARESRPPRGAPAIHWRLLTNRTVESPKDVADILHGYSQRWKIEELHRTWKSGACRVEDSQLHTASGVTKWAIIMAAIAARIERLKHLHRTTPQGSGESEFTPCEIAAIILMKRRHRRRNEPEPTPDPTLGELILWLGELGGYTGRSSGGPPGSITIRRGLDMVLPIAEALEQLREDSKM